ncbi:MAG: S16 family serine protease, partial [Candidatus Latescibacteria bacterium]|nr:S16 family serine protease [Candidatus Latescibacterota bacterium]
ESARAALSWLRASAGPLKIDLTAFDESDIHLHVPAGATPKEGPSAGIALISALVSLFTGRPVKNGVAMTGEITLRGRVLPVGGIRDKVLAAQRAGIRTVVLPKRNQADLDDVPGAIRRRLRFVLVEHIDEVLAAVLDAKRRPAKKQASQQAVKKSAPKAPARRATKKASRQKAARKPGRGKTRSAR